jgi:hypothetical protein
MSFNQVKMNGNYTIRTIHTVKIEGYEIVVFPNSTSDQVMVKINEIPKKGITVTIFDINGKNLLKVVGTNEQLEFALEMKNIPAGNYLLKVADNKGNHLQTFQVIKN